MLQHNALRGICPATVNLLMSVVSTANAESSVQTTALKCFTAMVMVLHSSLPHEVSQSIQNIQKFKTLILTADELLFITLNSIQRSKLRK